MSNFCVYGALFFDYEVLSLFQTVSKLKEQQKTRAICLKRMCNIQLEKNNKNKVYLSKMNVQHTTGDNKDSKDVT